MDEGKVEIKGHYVVREVTYGKDYGWVPAHALAMSACVRHTACPGRGSDQAGVVNEVIGRHISGGVLHPRHPGYGRRSGDGRPIPGAMSDRRREGPRSARTRGPATDRSRHPESRTTPTGISEGRPPCAR